MIYSGKGLCIIIVLFEISLYPYVRSALPKVVGGIPAKEDEFPYVVSLQYTLPRKHFCGGIILDVSHVLTACHCCGMFRGQRFDTIPPRKVVVVGGDVHLRKGQMRPVLRLTIHKKCGELAIGWTYDYCLVTLAQRFLYGTALKSIPLVSPDIEQQKEIIYNFADKTDCWAVGWGQQTFNSSDDYENTSDVLIKLGVVVLPWKECETRLCFVPKTRCVLNLRERAQICAVGKTGDVCKGDSGGPIVCNGFVYGIVSWGPACGELPFPSVFSVVSEGLQWPHDAWLTVLTNANWVPGYSLSNILLPLSIVYFQLY
ncbi:hypodermin-B-like [Cimex lectularius]|uniref:Peptidase S1 domain-containing protein n=1 Tax=Cimex lectularius TaxID=79782 RepID=A0A8I6RB22_CIMLE|nr:hypodermin-B-like [Cimex lectularius]